MGAVSEALRAELAAQPVGAGEILRGEYDGIVAALGGSVAVRAGRAGATLSDAAVARRLFRLVTALGLEGRLFLGRRPAPSRRHPAGAVVRVTWAEAPLGPARHGLRYARAYVRGATLGAGYLGDPRRGYHLEWTLDPHAVAAGADRLLARQVLRLGVRSGRAAGRRGGVRLYVKGGEAVAELLLQLGAGESVLRWENARALRAMRGRIHREVNAEAANLRRAARAGARQAEDVRALLERMGASLPPALESAARARLDHPEASLEELALVLGLTKSGANQRMRRLTALAAEAGLGEPAAGRSAGTARRGERPNL